MNLTRRVGIISEARKSLILLGFWGVKPLCGNTFYDFKKRANWFWLISLLSFIMLLCGFLRRSGRDFAGAGNAGNRQGLSGEKVQAFAGLNRQSDAPPWSGRAVKKVDLFMVLCYTFSKLTERQIGSCRGDNMRNIMVYQEYSTDREFRFEVYRNQNSYETWVQRKITDEYMGSEWFDYHDISDYMHRADTLERAIEIGKECLKCLLWKFQFPAFCDVILLLRRYWATNSRQNINIYAKVFLWSHLKYTILYLNLMNGKMEIKAWCLWITKERTAWSGTVRSFVDTELTYW